MSKKVTREELHHLVDKLSAEDLDDALDYLRWLTTDVDTLSDEEREQVLAAETRMAAGEYVTLEDLRTAK